MNEISMISTIIFLPFAINSHDHLFIFHLLFCDGNITGLVW